MIKKILLLFLCLNFLFLCLIPLGCDEEDTSGNNSNAKLSSKIGYVYAPVKPQIGRSGLSTGLIALEQNVPPEGYKAISGARVIIGNSKVDADDKGNFKISNIQPGEHQMLICASGFQPVVQVTAVSAIGSATVAIDTLKVIPEKAVVMKGDFMPFMAVGKDPEGNFIPLSSATWSVLNGDKNEKKELGTVTNTGLFKGNETGFVKVIAASATYTASSEATILDPAGTNTGTLTGKVSLASGSPVDGAQVVIPGTNLMSETDKDGKYSILDVPSDISLTLFVVKHSTIVGSGSIQLEKWKEKIMDIIATSNPPPIPEDANSVVIKDSTPLPLTTGTISGYVLAPANGDKPEKNFQSLSVIQSKIVPKGHMGISGVNVMLEEDPSISCLTSSDGGFTLNNVPLKKEGGPAYVVVVLDGYVSLSAPVLINGEYPPGAVTKLEIYPENPVIPVGGVLEFKVVTYDRKGQIIKTPKLDWFYEGDRGNLEPEEGIFSASKIGHGTISVNYGDISTKKNFKVIDKSETGSLSGVVLDKKEKPVKNAFIILDNSPWIGITDDEGKYNILWVLIGEKIPLSVKVDGKLCGDALASVGKGASAIEDISVNLTIEKQSIDPNSIDKPSIPDIPPASINPENTSGNNNIGNLPSNVVSSKITPTPREEFPRWPGGSQEDSNQKENKEKVKNNKSDESMFPRWPFSNSSEK
ncbi:MAG TPA: carboxypeptidase-like regulatory domain-containing protein [Candidatus Eremiobacteraeota bacterium]|nr:MAG: hypothetical protein BWY64_00058 [bacterium ADurb.Bin363]HPZ06801.1 carboxypeptidase-like regulatory domain-containing protein [Candidatus Eremiobacteraeota bacterium]